MTTTLYFSPEDGSCIFLRNIGGYLQVHTALQPKDQYRQRDASLRIVQNLTLPWALLLDTVVDNYVVL
jgi:hypothetical protein